ncbi:MULTISPECIES: efflux RND transporter periplasmic adaptor subunit [Sphingobacteriaceae]|uniref:Efflux RND transporter periplasmic adaptor subunit n=1 Tax=Pedobacter chinensis TaxID=2282421 RepID=A0A369PVC9_9SPHI|nr:MULTISPECIES: efflux RND transporter periplasmic adaptor subunit [Sphingobacteriaceae]RDC54078.1 efflux RND transporter periplasmic adaptor subunit [Pedobacter chinensis]
MKFNINKIAFVTVITVLIFAFSACNNNKDGNGQNQAKEINKEAHEEVPTIATLSEEQLKIVGIKIGTIEQRELSSTIKANGILNVPNNNKANATTLYGGVIRTLKVQLGDYVRKGEIIATIANPQFIQLQEEFLSVISKITFAEQELARQKELNEGNAGAKKNLQSATAELNSLRTRKASLHQQLQLMGINPSTLSNSNLKSALTVISPLNGTVSNVYAKIGSYVDVSSPVIEIVDNSSLHLDLQVFEKDLPQIKIGQTIHFRLTNNPTTEYEATVFNIGSSFQNESKTIAVRCRIKGNKIGLIDGMNITGVVSLSNVTTPAVPNDAIVNTDGKYFIFVQTDKKAEEHHEEGKEEENHKNDDKNEKEDKASINFEKIEILKGVSDMGYTAITFVKQVPANPKIVVKGAFFVNAKLSNAGEDED